MQLAKLVARDAAPIGERDEAMDFCVAQRAPVLKCAS
jgi:hypothetical protein